ncbi:MAG: hypothetical protein ABIB97_03560 [Patescibacteria group bacterium]
MGKQMSPEYERRSGRFLVSRTLELGKAAPLLDMITLHHVLAEMFFVANAYKHGYEKFPVSRAKRIFRSWLNHFRHGPWFPLCQSVGLYVSSPITEDDSQWIKRIDTWVKRTRKLALETGDAEGYLAVKLVEIFYDDLMAQTMARQYTPWIKALLNYLESISEGRLNKASYRFFRFYTIAPERFGQLELPLDNIEVPAEQPRGRDLLTSISTP